LERWSKFSFNTINNNEVKSENYIKSSVEYIDDILINLLKEERDLKLKIDPLYFQFQNDINSKMRAILIDWLIDVHLKFNFRQETLYITINIIDRYLSLKKIERCNFQLLGVTALFIACKQNEISFRKLNEYVYITDNAYSEEDIKRMENKVLYTLNFDLLFPSSLTFYEILSYKLNLYEDKKKFNFGEFLMESFYLDENCLKYSASTIACAVGYIVMKYFKMENYKECYNSNKFNIKPIKEFIDKFSKSNNYPIYIIKECAKDICYFMNNLSKGNLKSTIRKYSIAKYENVTNLLFGNVER
jgi:cyclin B